MPAAVQAAIEQTEPSIRPARTHRKAAAQAAARGTGPALRVPEAHDATLPEQPKQLMQPRLNEQQACMHSIGKSAKTGRKGGAGKEHAHQRQDVQEAGDDPGSQDGNELEADEPGLDTAEFGTGETDEGQTQTGTEDFDEGSEPADELQVKGKRKKVLTEDRLRRIKADYEKRGVVYVSRIPPHMKPAKLKQLLGQHGEVLRVYCTPEDPRTRKLRKQKGGNTGRNFTEGWVEFADKRIAKRTALALNGTQIGGKRRSAYYEDLWCLKYLRKFKWDHLTEEIAYQKAVREQRLAAEIRAARKERDHYLAQVDRAKAMAAIAGRKAAKQQQEAAGRDSTQVPSEGKLKLQGAGEDGPVLEGDGGQGGRRLRFFGQRRPRPDPADTAAEGGTRVLSDDVLMMIARKRQKVAVD